MNNSLIIGAVETKLIEQLSRFETFVKSIDGQEHISFRDSAGFLGREEDYKSRIAEEARKELNSACWNESWIGSGKIAACAKGAMSKAANLVNKNQQIDFKNRLDPTHPKYKPEAERVLYNIYRNSQYSESVAFADAVKAFGAKYDTIAFLFFIKDDSRFLPISTGHFDKGFEILGIKLKTSNCCSWENYQRFIDVIKEIRNIMEEALPLEGTPRLIDSHSFIWVIQEDRFIDWTPDYKDSVIIERTAEEIHGVVSGPGGRRRSTLDAFIRSSGVVKSTRERAKGVCQFCKQPAPFNDKKGAPYLEVHHVVWLSRGGEDSTANTVALCPNCHTRIHVLNDPNDEVKLKEIIGSYT